MSTRLLTVIIAMILLSGCGTTVPQIKEIWDVDRPGNNNSPNGPTPPISGSAQIEFEIKKRVFCDLRDAVREAIYYNSNVTTRDGAVIKRDTLLPLDWGAQISLSLEVEEHSALNPGVSFNEPYANAITNRIGSAFTSTPQSRAIGIGAELSSASTRTDKINAYYSVSYLISRSADKLVCDSEEHDPFRKVQWDYAKSSPFILTSSLGLSEWLVGSVWASRQLPSVGLPSEAKFAGTQDGPAKKPDTVSIDIKFVIISNGSINPSWKLVRIGANNGAPLFETGRRRTHQLIITLGPRNQQTDNSHLALQIGQAINSGGSRPFYPGR